MKSEDTQPNTEEIKESRRHFRTKRCSSDETEEGTQMKTKDTEPNAEEVEKVEDISEPSDVINSSDETEEGTQMKTEDTEPNTEELEDVSKKNKKIGQDKKN